MENYSSRINVVLFCSLRSTARFIDFFLFLEVIHVFVCLGVAGGLYFEVLAFWITVREVVLQPLPTRGWQRPSCRSQGARPSVRPISLNLYSGWDLPCWG